MRRKTVCRLETSDVIREAGKPREVIITFSPAAPDIIEVRAKGLRTSYPVTASDVYHLAVRQHVERVRREKKSTRTRRK